jgi:hypothetical protein
MTKFISARDWAKAWADTCLKLSIERKVPRPPVKLEILGSGPLNHKLHGKRREQGLHIVCTHIARGKVYDRKGKR